MPGMQTLANAGDCSGNPLGAYEQCGGHLWTGSTCCTVGYECTVTDESSWYSQVNITPRIICMCINQSLLIICTSANYDIWVVVVYQVYYMTWAVWFYFSAVRIIRIAVRCISPCPSSESAMKALLLFFLNKLLHRGIYNRSIYRLPDNNALHHLFLTSPSPLPLSPPPIRSLLFPFPSLPFHSTVPPFK